MTNAILYRKLFVQFEHIHWIHWKSANIHYIKRFSELPVHGVIRRFIKTLNTKTVIFSQIHSSYSWSGGTALSPSTLEAIKLSHVLNSFLILRAYTVHDSGSYIGTCLYRLPGRTNTRQRNSAYRNCLAIKSGVIRLCALIATSSPVPSRKWSDLLSGRRMAIRQTLWELTHWIFMSPHRIHCANITCTEILPNFIMDNATEAQLYSSFSSIGSATLVGFGLLNYRWVFSAGRFLQSAVASGISNPQPGGPVI